MEISPGENERENDLEHLTSTVARKIHEGVQKTDSFFSSACISRVPENLRKLNQSAYIPRLIAIGPLHREDEHLQTPLQHVKMRYTNDLLSRVTAGNQETFRLKIKECLADMKTLIDEAKKCYAAEVTLDEEMMLVDGCFILEYLYRRSRPENGHQTADPIFRNRLTTGYVDRDLLLIENQIPFFVLQKLFELTVDRINNAEDRPSLKYYVMKNYNRYMSPPEGSSNNSGSAQTWCSPRDCFLRIFGNEQESSTQEQHHNANYYHILHVLHDASMLPTSDETGRQKPVESLELMPSASELVYAGVKFVPGAAKNLFKVKFTEPKGLFKWFRSAHFEIPPLRICDYTEPLLRNLVALEQCCAPGVSEDVSSYVFLMDMLVNSDKDVQVLEKAGVMRNYLGASQDATHLFNNLTKEIILRYQFGETCKKATQYSERFWPRNMAHLRRTYFSSPWTFIALCAGFTYFLINFVGFVVDFLRFPFVI